MVDVFIRYPADSVVDIDDVQAKLVTGGSGGTKVVQNLTLTGGGGATTPVNVAELEKKNSSLFWGLVIFVCVLFLVVVVVLACYCCPGCYLYKEDGKKDGLAVLAVKNRLGKEIRDAKFVEVLKSARDRIRWDIGISFSRFLKNFSSTQLVQTLKHC